jgi:hypothetical protein
MVFIAMLYVIYVLVFLLCLEKFMTGYQTH